MKSSNDGDGGGGGGPRLDPLLSAYSDDSILPSSQNVTNAAIIAIFAYLVPLLTMEINYFRLAIYQSWRRQTGRRIDRNRKRKNQRRWRRDDSDRGGRIDGQRQRDNIVCGSSSSSSSSHPLSTVPNSDINIPPSASDVPIITENKYYDDDDDDGKEDNDNNMRCITSFDSCSSSSSASVSGNLVHDATDASRVLLGSSLNAGDASRRMVGSTFTGGAVNSNRDDDRDDNVNQGDNDADGDDGHGEEEEIVKLLLQRALHYQCIRRASAEAILSSLFIYSITALGVGYSTRGLDPQVVAIIVGVSQFVTSVMIVIVSAKVPQWIGVYHQGTIRLVKCSSNYSQNFERIDLHDPTNHRKLRNNVRLGVWFHFSKFYILLMPFYCGVRMETIPLSYISGGIVGFVLMWAVFLVHEKYIRHRNIVSAATILLLSILSAVSFTRGVAWIQVVWNWHMLDDEDLLLVSSFFAWLGMLAALHALFVWHTLKTDVARGAAPAIDEKPNVVGADDADANNTANENGSTPGELGKCDMSRPFSGMSLKRNSSYSSFVFDPFTHFSTDGKCQFTDHPDVEEFYRSYLTKESMDAPCSGRFDIVFGEGNDLGYFIETPVVMYDADLALDMNEDEAEILHKSQPGDNCDLGDGINTAVTYPVCKPNAPNTTAMDTRRHPCCRYVCCDVFVWNTSEYQQSSRLWKFMCWLKLIVITLSYIICLYFVAVGIGATNQITNTKALLPLVHVALYTGQNEGPVCGFDNKGPESNITTFSNKDAAHAAGFLVVHCGACGACSSWQNLRVQYSTRLTLASLSHNCAQDSLFGGGADAITECLMEPEIGFDKECAVCWMEDIVCTVRNCAFIYLQSQMINNVGNFRVGPDDITSASCEEAHCEVGLFVPCVGATRRRMNITSSIARPGDQQCAIVDVDDWGGIFFGSGVVSILG